MARRYFARAGAFGGDGPARRVTHEAGIAVEVDVPGHTPWPGFPIQPAVGGHHGVAHAEAFPEFPVKPVAGPLVFRPGDFDNGPPPVFKKPKQGAAFTAGGTGGDDGIGRRRKGRFRLQWRFRFWTRPRPGLGFQALGGGRLGTAGDQRGRLGPGALGRGTFGDGRLWQGAYAPGLGLSFGWLDLDWRQRLGRRRQPERAHAAPKVLRCGWEFRLGEGELGLGGVRLGRAQLAVQK